MRVFKHLKSDWFRYAFETIAVVVGILAAFALENWRDNLEVKNEEHEILVNMLSDLQDAKRQSSALIDSELQSRKNLISALDQQLPCDSLHEVFYVDSIFYNVLWYLEIEVPVINSYSDVKNTGKSGLITNEQIRQRFSNLELSINNLLNQIDDRLRVHQLRIDGISVDDLNYVRLISFRNQELSTDNESLNDYESLLKDKKIRNLIAIKLNLSNSVIIYRRALDAEIDNLITLLEDELEDINKSL